MSKHNWTNEQLNAITSRGGTLLLSAAAGSGKTAVLVERIIKLITDENNPVDPSGLLVVTFTKAAAAEMKARANAGIDELIRNNPSDTFLRSVKMKMADARITTMDSFCISLVRENFHMADIEPDFTMLDSGEEQILVADAMAETLDYICREKPEVYDRLNTVTSYGRNDNVLGEKILRLYYYSLSHPFPSQWLCETEKMYEKSDEDIKDTVWGKLVFQEVRHIIDYCVHIMGDALSYAGRDETVQETYSSELYLTLSGIERVREIIKNGSWDEMYNALSDVSFPSLPRAPRGYGKHPVKLYVENRYKQTAKLFGECSAYVCADSRNHREDMEILYPVVKALLDAVRIFGENYAALKKARNSYTFNDILHRALSLLVRSNDGEISKTPLALSLSETFSEILIDEYQDTNEAQDMLFSTLSSDGKNMFMVGDVKQSIYRFRLAMPEIFVRKSRKFGDYDAENYPAKIILGKNFRSRKGVLDNINFLFRNIMSEYVGEMDYTSQDALYYGEGYDEDTCPAGEIVMLETSEREKEAAHIASMIKQMVQQGVTVNDKNGKRKARYGDFCILLRSTKGKTEIYENALKKAGIGVSCEKKTGLFTSVEAGVFTSLLKVISNPTDDVAMLSVMFSPLYGFTADDAAKVKLEGRRKNLYSCLKDSADKMPKVRRLLDDIRRYRKMSAVTPVDAFVRNLLDSTGYLAVVTALEGGENRRLNLLMLTSLASDYAAGGGTDISGFVRFIAKVTENGAEVSAASNASSDSDVVKIYSIHKSKGLEFPYVILADCSKSFNMGDINEEMIISADAGVGMKINDNETLRKYPTVAYSAAKLSVKRAQASEEMRILYVALTRAREKFIAVCSTEKCEDEINRAISSLSGNKPSACAVLHATSYMRWLLMGFITHPDMAKAFTGTEFPFTDYADADSRLSVVITKPLEEDCADLTEKEAAAPCEEIMAQIKEKTRYEYPFVMPSDARPKRVASDFEEKSFRREFFAKSRPSFMSAGQLTPAQRGTANHLFLQNIDFNCTSVRAECERMTKSGILSPVQAESVRIDKVEKFLSGSLCERIRNASAVYREKEFTVQISLDEIYENVAENVKDEKILVLGKADLVFVENGEAVVVDYKTDRTKSREDFIDAYSGQLDIYCKAMQQLLGVPVKEAVIYSLELGEEISIQK